MALPIRRAPLPFVALLLATGCTSPAPDEADGSSGDTDEQDATTSASSSSSSASSTDDLTDAPSLETTTDAPDGACTPGDVALCTYTGPADTATVGACQPATRECDADGRWGRCAGEVVPTAEDCRTPADENCDGQTTCTGAIEWLRGFGEPSEGAQGEAVVRDVAVDGLGRAWLTGSNDGSMRVGTTSWHSGDDRSFFLARVSGDGVPEYAHADARAGVMNEGQALSLDRAGNVAYSVLSLSSLQLAPGAPILGLPPTDGFSAIGLLDADASHPRGVRMANLAGGFVYTADVAHDSAGNVWVAGTYIDAHAKLGADPDAVMLENHGGADALLVQLAPTGEILQAHGFGDAKHQQFRGIAIDASDNVYLVGDHEGSLQLKGGALAAPEGSYAAFIVKLDREARYVWGSSYSGTDVQNFWKVRVDATGEAVVAGTFYTEELTLDGYHLGRGAGDHAMLVARWDAAGKARWAQSWPCVGSCGLTSLDMDGAGQVVIAAHLGQTTNLTVADHKLLDELGQPSSAVVKLDRKGTLTWPPRVLNADVRVAVGPTGSIYVTGAYAGKVDFTDGPGYQLDAGDDTDIFVARYLP